MGDVGFMNPRPGTKCGDALSDATFAARPSACSLDSGYSFWVIQAPPRADQIPRICSSANCQNVITAMRKASATECVMSDGFFLYQDILNPILAQCGQGPAVAPAPAPAPATPAPAPVPVAGFPMPQLPPGFTLPPGFSMPSIPGFSTPTSAPAPAAGNTAATPAPSLASGTPAPSLASGGEQPIDATWAVPTTAPSIRSSYGPAPADSTRTSTASSDSSSGPPLGLIFGIAVGVILLIALLLWCRQSRKRDPNVQREQQLIYGPEGCFDTVHPSPPTPKATPKAPYVAMEVSEPSYASVGKSQEIVPTPVTVGVSENKSSNYSTVSDLTTQIPLMLDEQITAVRVPFDKVTILERISSGGFGEVYMGTYKQDPVAIKKMLPQHRSDAKLINKLLGEVKLMASLEHECIVRFVGVAWDSAATVCVLSEFMEGGDLRTMLKRLEAKKKPIGFDRTKLKIAMDVAHALTYMHSLQPMVLHRDLKSRNILLSKNMDAKVADFGVSRERGDMTMTQGVGTSLWMAPEIMMGGRYDQKADIFSFGVVLSELDSNQLPYATQMNLKDGTVNYGELMQSVAHGRLTVEFSYESDPDIVALGRDCVAVDPQQRPTAAEAMHRVHQVLRQYDGFA